MADFISFLKPSVFVESPVCLLKTECLKRFLPTNRSYDKLMEILMKEALETRNDMQRLVLVLQRTLMTFSLTSLPTSKQFFACA